MSEPIQLTTAGQSIVIRRAEAEELIDLRQRVLRAGLPRSEAIFAGDELSTNYHFGAFVAEDSGPSRAAICCASFHLSRWQNSPAWQLRGMATDPAWERKGIGRALLEYSVAEILHDSPIQLFWCNARVGAIRFYEKLGWRVVSERFEIPTAGPHHQMVLESR